MKLSLVVMVGNAQNKEIPIKSPQFIVGRDTQCQLRPASPVISKRHCAFLLRDGKAYLKDFGSTNGTFVNEKALKGEVELQDGDAIKIGPLEFRIKLRAEDAAEKPTPKPATVAPAGVKAAAVKATVPADSGSKTLDDDSITELMMSFDDATGGGAAGGGDAIPEGSTILEMRSPLADQPSGETPKPPTPDPKKGGAKPGTDKEATSNAAKAILDKYMRRPRN